MSTVALVTGANQGLGLALVAGLCEALPPDSTVYLTARNPDRGLAAIRQLEERGLTPRLELLDVADEPNQRRLADTLARRHGGLDILIGNAAARIGKESPQSEQVRTFVTTNNLGTTRLMRSFGPLLRDGARLLVVASSFGSLRHLHPTLHRLFDVERSSLDDLDRVMLDYVNLVERGEERSELWPDWINVPSKIGQVAATKVYARQRRDVFVAAVCPGLVDTDASRPWFADMSQAQTPAAAAADVVWLATAASPKELHGELVRHRQTLAWR